MRDPATRFAQKYPEREIRIINPYAPGGSADITGRLVAQKMAEIIGGQFIVENRAGAGGSIGAEAVAKATPDGHTLLYSAAGPLGVNHKLFARPPAYDPATGLHADRRGRAHAARAGGDARSFRPTTSRN